MSGLELKMRNGDYVPAANGDFETVSGEDEVLQRAMLRLQARRGCFDALPDYGSRLYTLCRLKPGERAAGARTFAEEALAAEPEVQVGEVRYTPGADGGARLEIELLCGGRSGTLALDV